MLKKLAKHDGNIKKKKKKDNNLNKEKTFKKQINNMPIIILLKKTKIFQLIIKY